MKQIRTLKIEIHPTASQRDLLYRMMRASADIYNILIDFVGYKRKRWQELKDAGIENPYKEDSFCDLLQAGWATELIRTLIPQKASLYPRTMVNKPAKNGKRKGEERFVIATEKHAKSDYGVPAQTQGLICDDFEANIKSFFTHRKNGNSDAELPKRKKGLHTLFFSNQLVKRRGDRIILGAKPYVITLRVPELFGVPIDSDIKISRSRGGTFHFHVTQKFEVEPNPELTEIAAVDFGQKRAMVLAVETSPGIAKTALISGKDILALKRERDLRYREVNRLRSRVLKGQIRQYLTAEEKETYRQLQERDNERQRLGKPRKGADIKYALRIINQRRKEQGMPKRSRRSRLILRTQRRQADYYRKRLTYANHCVTRGAVDWCVENKVGTVYVGKLDSLPKGRKKGLRRITQVARNNRWEMPTQAKYLEEKLILAGGVGTEEASEAYTSQVCPNCGRRHKPRNRIYHCSPRRGGCGWIGDRDGVGSANFLSSVKYGACGNVKPAHQSTLRISPAIRQGLHLLVPDGKPVCDSVEAVVKGHKPTGLQASDIVQTATDSKATRKPRITGKTQRRGGTDVLANAATSDPTAVVTPVATPQPVNSGEPTKRQKRSLQNQPTKYIQLNLWSSA